MAAPLALLALLALVAVAGVTQSAFSGTAASSGNTFDAAASFGPNHFTIDAIPEQHSGRAFTVTVRARNSDGSTQATFNGTVTFSTNSGTITTTSKSFVAGVLSNHSVQITGPYSGNQTITVTDTASAATGTSAPFVLHDWKLYLKKTSPTTGTSCSTANRMRDMAEGYAGADPEESFARTNQMNTLSFCSRTFAAGEKLAAGTARLEGFTSNTGNGLCNVTASLFHNGTRLGSMIQPIPGSAGAVSATSWPITIGPVSFAAGDRMSVLLSWEKTAACSKVSFYYGGTTNRSRLELPY